MATLKRVFIIALLFLIPALARADSVWTFNGELTDSGSWRGGQPFTHCNCSLDGTVLFDDNYNVLAYSFTDGTHTLNNQNSTIVFPPLPAGGREFGTGEPFDSPLDVWSVDITGGDVVFHTNYNGPTQGAVSMNFSYVGNTIFGFGQPNSGPDGTWTEVVSTLEPSSLISLLAGITALALAISVQKHSA
jgi:hypothetical protein